MLHKFAVIKKNRKYFVIEKENGFKCKLLIDKNSENLELGDHQLDLVDVSIKSKYGTDVIYKLSHEAEEQEQAGVCSLKAPFNSILVEKAKALGGRWIQEEQAWIFTSLVEEEVELLDIKYNSDFVEVEITTNREVSDYNTSNAPADVRQSMVCFCGVPLVVGGTGRDSGAKVADKVAFVAGAPKTGGSRKNWYTYIPENAVIRTTMPRGALEHNDDDSGLTVKIL